MKKSPFFIIIYKKCVAEIVMSGIIRVNFSMKPEVNNKMKEQSDRLGMNKSAYLAYLINVVGKGLDNKGDKE